MLDMLDEKYIQLEKERLITKYKCQTIDDVIQILEEIIKKNKSSASLTSQVS